VAVAETVADAPAVVTALKGTDPDAPTPEQVRTTSAVLQPYAENVRQDTSVDFVVVMALDRTRFTHPNPANIGEPFVGDLGDAPEGGVFTQQYKG